MNPQSKTLVAVLSKAQDINFKLVIDFVKNSLGHSLPVAKQEGISSVGGVGLGLQASEELDQGKHMFFWVGVRKKGDEDPTQMVSDKITDLRLKLKQNIEITNEEQESF